MSINYGVIPTKAIMKISLINSITGFVFVQTLKKTTINEWDKLK